MLGTSSFLEDLGRAWTCPRVKSRSQPSEGEGFLLLVVFIGVTAGLDR